MKSVLREFIRESLQQEVVSSVRLKRTMTTAGQTTLDPKRTSLGDYIVNLLSNASKDGGAIAKWLADPGNDKRPPGYNARMGALNLFQQFFGKNVTKAVEPTGPAGRAAPGAAKSPAAAKILTGLGVTAGLVTTVWAGYHYLYSNLPPEEAAKKSSENFMQFYTEMMKILSSKAITHDLSFKAPITTFDNDWEKIRDHYQEIASRLTQIASYDDYFTQISASTKDQFDQLIGQFNKANVAEVEETYKSISYGCLVYYTTESFITAAFASDLTACKDLTQEQADQATSFMIGVIDQIKSGKPFKDSKDLLAQLEIN